MQLKMALERYLNHIRKRVSSGTHARIKCQLESTLDRLGLVMTSQCETQFGTPLTGSVEKLQCEGKITSQALRELFRLLDWLASQGAIKRNPLPEEIIPRTVPTQKEPPKLSDVLELLNKKVETPVQIRNRMMVRLFYFTGMRPVSLAGIRLDDIAEDGIWITIKGGARLLQAVDPEEMALLLHYIEWVLPHVVLPNSDNQAMYLFPSVRGKRMERGSILAMFHDQLGTSLTPYSLRHAVAQGMWDQGASSLDIIDELGHDGVKSIKKYVTEHNLDRTRALLEQFHPLFQQD